MAGKHNFDAPIDLHQHELLNARLQALITLPADPFEGQICYGSHPDIKLGALWNGTEWTFFGLTIEQINRVNGLVVTPTQLLTWTFDGSREFNLPDGGAQDWYLTRVEAMQLIGVDIPNDLRYYYPDPENKKILLSDAWSPDLGQKIEMKLQFIIRNPNG